MRRFNDGPKELSELLDDVAGRLKKVDLRLIDEVRELWPRVVDPVLAEHCHPEFVKNGVLLVSVPSGAFAQRITQLTPSILEGFATLGDRAPTSLRTVTAAT